ncbi:MAG TPA: (2Fe-2S)-binding protein [Candidatus Scatomorpha pullistercoris]|uniref:(2Fe-2S)-binding protein n=1 Tax=Candidatus Scatomorpha pullistercoris TaxID=2840929 RepID=A0A9D1K714_9FIRM|nr:(2Fe-2S)-binding protein [Candidatus Scatomorpha pullistercoris]
MSERQFKRIRCTINGRPVDTMVDVRASLTDLLRNDFSLTSVKKGCEVGECGACTVLIDGETYNSCIYLAVWADGRSIVTVDGLLGPDGSLSPIQQAFVDEGAIQCGFCTPGIILSAQELIDRGEPLTDEQLRRALAGHLCRCTGYENIFKAVRKALDESMGK